MSCCVLSKRGGWTAWLVGVLAGVVVLALCTRAAVLALSASAADKGDKSVDQRVYELRTYYAADGKMEALHARFRDHTLKLFDKHGLKVEGFWKPIDDKAAGEKLIYLLSFPSKDAAAKSWKEFQDDPDWKAAKAESEKDGKLVDKVESVYLTSTDYAPMK